MPWGNTVETGPLGRGEMGSQKQVAGEVLVDHLGPRGACTASGTCFQGRTKNIITTESEWKVELWTGSLSSLSFKGKQVETLIEHPLQLCPRIFFLGMTAVLTEPR